MEHIEMVKARVANIGVTEYAKATGIPRSSVQAWVSGTNKHVRANRLRKIIEDDYNSTTT